MIDWLPFFKSKLHFVCMIAPYSEASNLKTRNISKIKATGTLSSLGLTLILPEETAQKRCDILEKIRAENSSNIY